MLSPSLSLDYRHLVDYILYAQSIPSTRRDNFVSLWHRTRHYRWGPFRRLVTASKSLGMHVEDPFVFVFIRDSCRQLLLQRSMKRRIDCSGPISQVNIALTRKFFFFTSKPLHKQMVRYCLTGALDHAQRLYKSNLLSTPTCIHCGQVDETAKHLFWDCRAWQPTHNKYPVLMIF